MLINNLCLGVSPFNSIVGLWPSPFQAVPPQNHGGLTQQQTKPTVSKRCPPSLALRDRSKILKGRPQFKVLGGHFWGTAAVWTSSCSFYSSAATLGSRGKRLFWDTAPFTITGLRKGTLLPWMLSEQWKSLLGTQGQFQRLSEAQQEQGSGAAQGTLGRSNYFCPEQLCLLCKM